LPVHRYIRTAGKSPANSRTIHLISYREDCTKGSPPYT
jgi:hypothetical protein